MRMLEQGQDADVDVSWEDQQCINAFSRLNNRLAELEEVVEQKTKEEEYLQDAQTELELEDDDAQVPFRVGDAFVQLRVETARERLQQDAKRSTEEVAGLRKDMSELEAQLDTLKKKLYAKFGNAINLERPA